MFTVKLVRRDGSTKVRACDSYEKTPLSGCTMPVITLFSKAGEEKMSMLAGETLYVENLNGKTVDVIRTPRSQAT